MLIAFADTVAVRYFRREGQAMYIKVSMLPVVRLLGSGRFSQREILTGFSAVYFVCIISDGETWERRCASDAHCSAPRVREQRAGRQCNSKCPKRRFPFQGMRLYLPMTLAAYRDSNEHAHRILFRGAGAAAKTSSKPNVKMYCV